MTMPRVPAVLVLCGDAQVTSTLQPVLGSFPIRVRYADSVAAAQAVLIEGEPDCLLVRLAIGSPDWAALMHLMTTTYPGVPAVALCAPEELRAVAPWLGRGVADYAPVPIDGLRLQVALRNAVDRRELLREVYRLRAALSTPAYTAPPAPAPAAGAPPAARVSPPLPPPPRPAPVVTVATAGSPASRPPAAASPPPPAPPRPVPPSQPTPHPPGRFALEVLETHPERAFAVLRIGGSIDENAAVAFAEKIGQLKDSAAITRLIVDLESVTHIASRGLHVFAIMTSLLDPEGTHGQVVALVNVRGYVKETLERLGLSESFLHCRTIDEAKARI